MSELGLAPVGLVLIWLLATILYQWKFFRTFLGRIDLFKLLPSWSFFAPNPATRDSHIVIRDLLRNGTTSVWRPVSAFPTRAVRHVIWHPAKRPRKILRD